MALKLLGYEHARDAYYRAHTGGRDFLEFDWRGLSLEELATRPEAKKCAQRRTKRKTRHVFKIVIVPAYKEKGYRAMLTRGGEVVDVQMGKSPMLALYNLHRSTGQTTIKEYSKDDLPPPDEMLSAMAEEFNLPNPKVEKKPYFNNNRKHWENRLLKVLRSRLPRKKRVITKKDRRLPTSKLLDTPEWKAIRLQVLERDGKVCKRCGVTENLHVDHILPKSKFPHLVFALDNLQVLCGKCNFRKRREEETHLKP